MKLSLTCLGAILLLLEVLAHNTSYVKRKCGKLTETAIACLNTTSAEGLPSNIKRIMRRDGFNKKVLSCYYGNENVASAKSMCQGPKSLQLLMTCMKTTLFSVNIGPSYHKSALLDLADRIADCLATRMQLHMPYGRVAIESQTETWISPIP
uniref:Putative secreted protein n=1 Tax=Rhipicephalus microplus TaxID=6941 RepID=A0A6G5A501_RHIMP